MTRLPLLALILAPPAIAAAQQTTVPAPLAITHVTVIDTRGGPSQTDMTVVIREGRISGVAGAGGEVPVGASVVEGRGRFLMPGLWDMHVHLSWTTNDARLASALPVLVANGVTGVRDVGGHLGELDEWRTRIAAGLLVGPRIVRAGPILNGRTFNQYQLATGNPDEARGIVRALKQVGVDFIKVHRRTPRDAYFAIIDEAKKQGLMVVGHVPITVTPEEASDAGQQIEHAYTLFEGTLLAGRPEEQIAEVIETFRATPAADSLIARLARNRTVIDATLVPYYQITDSAWFQSPHMRYVARSLKEAWQKNPMVSARDLDGWRRTYIQLRGVVGQMHRAGVAFVTGTDLAVIRPPGFTVHQELALLVDAGLTPLEAIQAGTLTPARVMKLDADYGAVEAGKIADLILLDADPLADIHNTERISAVVLAGKLLRRGDLDALLRAGEEMAGRN